MKVMQVLKETSKENAISQEVLKKELGVSSEQLEFLITPLIEEEQIIRIRACGNLWYYKS